MARTPKKTPNTEPDTTPNVELRSPKSPEDDLDIRPLDRFSSGFEMYRKSDKKHYVWISSFDRQALSRYKAMGYRPVLYELTEVDGQKRFVGEFPAGTFPDDVNHADPIEMGDHTLYSMPRERHDAINKTAQAEADIIEERMVKYREMKDGFRGISSRKMYLEEGR